MAAKRGRTKGFVMSPEHRDKIQRSNILRRLIDFSEGKEGVEMSSAQVTAATSLLDRVMPKLQSVELTGDPDNPVETVTRVELVAPK